MEKYMTKSEKLINALSKGESLTAAQIAARFGISNPTATVSDLRFSGYPIYTNKRKNSTTKYRLGTPRRDVIAAGYRALASSN